MSSAVDIANLALAYIGDAATVVALNPPEGSTQAQTVARAYPQALDDLLQQHPWSFALRSVAPNQLSLDPVPSGYAYAYALPTNLVRVVSVPATPHGLSGGGGRTGFKYGAPEGVICPENYGFGGVPQIPYELLSTPTDQRIVVTNHEIEELRYVYREPNPDLYSPTFRQALAWHLASLIAGPLIRGTKGAQMADMCQQKAAMYIARAAELDANEDHAPPQNHHVPDHYRYWNRSE